MIILTSTGFLFIAFNLLHTTTEGFRLPHIIGKVKTSRTGSAKLVGAISAVTSGTTEASKEEKRNQKLSYANFDYLDHWYPVSWARDLQLYQPTKVTVFDVDYVVAKTLNTNGDEEVMALLDQCPHRSASLSEGRVALGNGSTGTGIQCSYHGWKFDKDGRCLEVPQLTNHEDRATTRNKISISANTKALPAMIEQGVVWIFPGGMELALLSPPPPRVPEIDLPGFRQTQLVREFPVDWPILIENICDPDHGFFAHGNKNFDFYTASYDHPQTVEEEILTVDAKHFSIKSSVDSVKKLLSSSVKRDEKNEKDESSAPIRRAITNFIPPNMIYMGRRDPGTGETSFVSTFHICPSGVGRTKLLLGTAGKLPFNLPRWFLHMTVNKFLDQDTFLIYTQQKYLLEEEKSQIVKILEGTTDNSNSVSRRPLTVRRQLYKRLSPSEKFHVRIGNFFDETLTRVPNRISVLKESSLVFDKGREYVLDRYHQSTKHCPDSLNAVENCTKIKRSSVFAALIMSTTHMILSTQGGQRFLPSMLANLKILKSRKFALSVGVLSTTVWLAAHAVKKEFFFNYGEVKHRKDNERMSKDWPDIK